MSEILFSPFSKKDKAVYDSKKLERLIIKFSKSENRLLKIEVRDLVAIFDQLSAHWQAKDSKLYSLFIEHNLGFLIGWLKKKNILDILNTSISNIDILDGPAKIGTKYIYAAPKGIVVHWIAGNVPLLGVLSLFQGILAKNKNIVKVPSTFKNVLVQIIRDVSSKEFAINGKTIQGKDITDSILITYVEKTDLLSQGILSKYADVRYAWGGREAIESIIGLDKKIDCEDIIMGPKTSLSVVSKEFLEDGKAMKDLANKITRDVFAFDQRGCNAPHNIYVEESAKNTINDFANILAERFSIESKKRNLLDKQPIDTFKILSERVLFNISKNKDVICSDDYEYSIFLDHKDKRPSMPLYNRSIYLKSVKNIDIVPEYFPFGLQSVGIAMPKDKINLFSIKAAKYGALRITNIGSMSVYDSPWDGIFPISRLIKWVSVPI